MKTGVPVVILGLPLMALWLTRNVKWKETLSLPAAEAWRVNEVRVLVVFGITILLWITRAAPSGGWSGLLGVTGIGDGHVAMAGVVAMFLVPSGQGDRLLDWKTAGGYSLEHITVLHQRRCHRQSVFIQRSGGTDRATAGRPGDASHTPAHPVYLSGCDFPDRNHFQYSNNRIAAACLRSNRADRGCQSRADDDFGNNLGIVRFHAPDLNRTQCDCIRDRSGNHTGNGERRCNPQFYTGVSDYPGVLPDADLTTA